MQLQTECEVGPVVKTVLFDDQRACSSSVNMFYVVASYLVVSRSAVGPFLSNCALLNTVVGGAKYKLCILLVVCGFFFLRMHRIVFYNIWFELETVPFLCVFHSNWTFHNVISDCFKMCFFKLTHCLIPTVVLFAHAKYPVCVYALM